MIRPLSGLLVCSPDKFGDPRMRNWCIPRALLAMVLCCSIGCQAVHDVTSLDHLIKHDRPRSNPTMIAKSTPPPRPEKSNVHYVSYAPDATAGDAKSAIAVVPSIDLPTSDSSSGSITSLTNNGPPPRFEMPSMTRGQTPLRSVFASDAFLMAVVIAAAVVIPFAVHDSRLPNPPNN